QGTALVPFLTIDARPTLNTVVISTLTLQQLGTITTSTGPVGQVPGDGDVSKLWVYVDTNFNSEIDIGDTLVGQLDRGANFHDGTAVIPFSTPVTFNTSGGRLLIAGDVATIDASSSSTQGHSVGFALAAFGGLSLQ